MKYISTRGNYKAVSGAEAIRLGMVPAGGLFVPEHIPEFTIRDIEKMQQEDYQDIALKILQEFLTDFNKNKLREAIYSAYYKKSFPPRDITPLVKLDKNKYILELWHGPTAAFKDLALQLMPYLLRQSIEKIKLDKEVVILVATSGDTGKAALEGFKDIPGIKVIVFFPAGGVSSIQKRQMVTTGGKNTSVVAVNGNFDDCQNAVKELFADKEFNEYISENGYQFSSANSINWGRLVPQIVYYFVAYVELLKRGEINKGQPVDITVPTGNFGNILAAYYAYKMGLPVNRFICASNENKILTDFLKTGVYDINRDFKKTISPSMDILISSNLERFLFVITANNYNLINQWYNDLRTKGRFQIDDKTKEKIQKIFIGEYSDEKETKDTIGRIKKELNYLPDPHTAVGIKAYEKYQKKNIDIPVIIASTASPYKFSRAVLESIKCNFNIDDEFDILQELRKCTNTEIHRALKNLNKKEVKHSRVCKKDKIKDEILDILQ